MAGIPNWLLPAGLVAAVAGLVWTTRKPQAPEIAVGDVVGVPPSRLIGPIPGLNPGATAIPGISPGTLVALQIDDNTDPKQLRGTLVGSITNGVFSRAPWSGGIGFGVTVTVPRDAVVSVIPRRDLAMSASTGQIPEILPPPASEPSPTYAPPPPSVPKPPALIEAENSFYEALAQRRPLFTVRPLWSRMAILFRAFYGSQGQITEPNWSEYEELLRERSSFTPEGYAAAYRDYEQAWNEGRPVSTVKALFYLMNTIYHAISGGAGRYLEPDWAKYEAWRATITQPPAPKVLQKVQVPSGPAKVLHRVPIG